MNTFYMCDDCPVCFEVISYSRNQSCGHIICTDCINNMMKHRTSRRALPCPLCRAPIGYTGCNDNEDIERLTQIIIVYRILTFYVIVILFLDMIFYSIT